MLKTVNMNRVKSMIKKYEEGKKLNLHLRWGTYEKFRITRLIKLARELR